MNFDHKIILISGAAKGIGRKIALKFAELNSFIIITDFDKKAGEVLETEINKYEVKSKYYYFDFAKIDQIERKISEIISIYKKIDVLINNVGVCPMKSFEHITIDEWNQVINLNLSSIFFLTKEVVKYMMQRKYGKVVNVSSVASKVGGISTGPHYVASKGGIDSLTRYFAKKLANNNINVNAVSPSTTDTELIEDWDNSIIDHIISMTPLKRLATANDIANAVLFLSSDNASFITGEILNINGGFYMD